MAGRRRDVKDGSATVIVVIILVVVGLAATLFFANEHKKKKIVQNYQRELVAQAEAEKARAAAAAQAEKDRAEEEAAQAKAEADEKAKKAAQVAEKEQKDAEKKAKITRFEDADQAFIGAQADFWSKADSSGEPTWCLVPQEGGEGRIFEIIPGKDGAASVVKALDENKKIQTMTFELFQTRHLNGDINWFELRDGKALLRTTQKSKNAEQSQDKFSIPQDGRDFDIAEHLYGDAAKAVKVYKMTPPPIQWNVAFVTKKGVTVPVGKVGFGEGVKRAMFRPAAEKLLQQVAARMNRDAASGALAAAKDKQTALNKPYTAKKRTHFLYDKGTVKRTVDGLVYVPRQYKAARKEFNRNERQREQDEARNAAHKAEWEALYAEALRQEREEIKARAEWERSRAKAAVSKPSVADVPRVTVQSEHIEAALEAGTFIFSRAEATNEAAPTENL